MTQFERLSKEDWDIVVIGAGPAGAMAALNLADEGLSVLLVERAKFPRYKVCGCCVSQTALKLLEKRGLRQAVEQQGVPIDTLDLFINKRHVAVSTPSGRALSRSIFDQILVSAAQERGVFFCSSTSATVDLVDANWRTVLLHSGSEEKAVRCKVVVVADGLSGTSLVGREEMQWTIQPSSLVGIGCVSNSSALTKQIVPGHIHMYCSANGYIGLVQVEQGTVDIAAAVQPHFLRSRSRAGAAAQDLLEQSGLNVDVSTEHWRGTPQLTRKRNVATERLFVLGDAASYVEPFTGEGISWALSCAELVVPYAKKAVTAWDGSLEKQWQNAYKRAISKRQNGARLVASLLRHYRLCSALARLVERIPQLAAPFVRMVYKPSSLRTQR